MHQPPELERKKGRRREGGGEGLVLQAAVGGEPFPGSTPQASSFVS